MSGYVTPTYMDLEKSASVRNSPAPSKEYFTIREVDENGEICRIYERKTFGTNLFGPTPPSDQPLTPTSPQLLNSVSTLQYLINVFLPTGYPNSVTPDYFNYQVFDSFQAFSSSIASLFANRAVLSAVGVGDESATSTSALFMKIIQETIGRLGTICFAWKYGSALEPECKKYRFMADLFNDSAMVFDCLAPLFPFSKKAIIGMLCMSGLLRSICGVMAGGSRAALTQHFTDPVRGSIADVNAKDQSQETVISLLGMLAGSVVVGVIKGEGLEMWVTMLALLTIHLWTNYRAVSSVVLKNLNRQRTNIIFADIAESLDDLRQSDISSLSNMLMSPRKVSARENILEPSGILRNSRGKIVGHAQYCGFEPLLQGVKKSNIDVSDLIGITKRWGYVIWYSIESARTNIFITLFDEPNSSSTNSSGDLHAWVHAYLIAEAAQESFSKRPINDNKVDIYNQERTIRKTAETVALLFEELHITSALSQAGWDVSNRNLISRPVKKISIGHVF